MASDWRERLNRRLRDTHFCLKHSGPCGECELRQDIRALMSERAAEEHQRLVLAAVLEELCDLQNGCPLPKYEQDWTRVMAAARAALAPAEEHRKHPSGDYCVFCRSQWPCAEAQGE